MTIAGIGGTLTDPSTQVRRTDIGQEDLFKILLTQLTYQDPLKPLDNQEFVAQLAQFTDLEQTREINEKIDSLLAQQAATQSIGLINRTVEARTDNGSAIGQVIAITFNTGNPLLTIKPADGQFLEGVSLSQISVVR